MAEAVAALVAEAALSAAFDALFGKLSSQDLLKYARRNNVESEVNQWNKFLQEMNYVLDDAEERQMSEGPIKIWLDDLRDLAYDVEDILDKFSYEVMRQKFMAESETEASTSKFEMTNEGATVAISFLCSQGGGSKAMGTNPIYSDLPLGTQRRQQSLASLRFSIMGPKLSIQGGLPVAVHAPKLLKFVETRGPRESSSIWSFSFFFLPISSSLRFHR